MTSNSVCTPLLQEAGSPSHRRLVVTLATSGEGIEAQAQPDPRPQDQPQRAAPLEGAKPVPTLVAVGLGLALRFLVPCPDGVTLQGWSLLSIFVVTVVGLLAAPLPVGAWAVVCVTVAMATGTLPFENAFAAMTNEVIWLIVASFFFAKGFEKTGLGERVANLFVAAVGRSTLGLAYGLAAADVVVAPAMPSTSARAGGIFMPVIASLARTLGSQPGDESRNRVGAFLTASQFQASMHSSNLFLTGAAQNLLCIKLAAQLGVDVPAPFTTWLLGACVPALAGLLLTPPLVMALQPPELRSTPDAPAAARRRLKELGPLSSAEWVMLACMVSCVALWMLGDVLGVRAVVAAWLGLSGLLLAGVLKWDDCLSYRPAWDTLIWFAILIAMSSALAQAGVVSWMAGGLGSALTSLSLPWPALFAVLHVAFFTLHYLFASQTAHIGALFAAFLQLMLGAGVPQMLAVMSLSYAQNLFGSITHYASGQAAVFCGSGYQRLNEVFKVGALVGIAMLLVYAGLGMVWWKVLGWW